MAKNNPLFVDSTLLHGDRIGTQIELNGILIYEDESVTVMVTNHLDESYHVPMKMAEDGTFQARLWLSHQKMVMYRFVVERNGKPIYQSAAGETRAQYAIVEQWQPIFNEPITLLPPTKVMPGPQSSIDRPLFVESARNVTSLIEKWGF